VTDGQTDKQTKRHETQTMER